MISLRLIYLIYNEVAIIVTNGTKVMRTHTLTHYVKIFVRYQVQGSSYNSYLIKLCFWYIILKELYFSSPLSLYSLGLALRLTSDEI